MIASACGVTYSYPRAATPALRDVSVAVEVSVLHLVTGPSGGGKSTFLRLFNGLVPQFHGGTLSGSVRVAGLDPARTPARQAATIAGMVFQVPEDQAIADNVEAEIAFGLEQAGVPRATMRRRVDSLAATLAVDHLLQRPLSTLSGGERQRVELAAVLALQPPLLLLDEPSSQLDPAGAHSFLQAVTDAMAEAGTTVLIAEHRTSRLFPAADRVLHIDDGALCKLSPSEAARDLAEAPPLAHLARRLHIDPSPVLSGSRVDLPPHAVVPPPAPPSPGKTLLAVRGLSVTFGELTALDEIDLTIREGEIVALIGANGSGKTSLFRALAGTVTPAAGEVDFQGIVAPPSVAARTAFAGYLPQDPTLAFYRETLADEVGLTLRQRHLDPSAAQALIDAWGLSAHAGANPRDLSVGQQERAALATMLAHRPPVWLLDEPTRGADVAAHARLATILREHAAVGGAAIVATHDIESAAAWATRVVGLDRGRVTFDLSARHAFGHTGPMPTSVARLVPGALLPAEVRLRC